MTIVDEGYKYFKDLLGKHGEEHANARENPYINGPREFHKALEWWQGFNKARTDVRLMAKEKPDYIS